VEVGRAARDLVLQLRTPADTLTGAGDGIRGVFDDAARTAGQLPLVGEDLARALGAGTGAGDSLATAGRDMATTFATIASGTAVAVVVLGVLPVLLTWLPRRVRYARAAASAARMRATDTDLLALRALTNQPVSRLLGVSPDPAAAWRRDDREAVRALATLELSALGLHAPRRAPD
jgi:hypothetical protein